MYPTACDGMSDRDDPLAACVGFHPTTERTVQQVERRVERQLPGLGRDLDAEDIVVLARHLQLRQNTMLIILERLRKNVRSDERRRVVINRVHSEREHP